MTKEELFKKYHIIDTLEWCDEEEWLSVEIFRIMNNGELPKPDNFDVTFVCDFLDDTEKMRNTARRLGIKTRWYSLYITARRMIFRHHEDILRQLAERDSR